MAISSNSIIHYTRKYNALKNIIKEKSFRLKYCVEKIMFSSNEDDNIEIAIPMVSFCDIPFSNIGKHVKEYGNYGIGLNKEWAVKNQLNPVIYLENNSFLTLEINTLFDLTYDANRLDGNIHKDWERALTSYNGILCFIKSYSGDIKVVRDNRFIKNYRFYDEREWRYVCLDKSKLVQIVLIDEYKKNKEELNKKAFEIKIPFTMKDLSYIVLEKQIQVEAFLKYIENNTDIMMNEICAKIITIEQINNDF